MSKVYMDCAWFIFDGFDLDETLRLSHVLECEIWFRETKGFLYDEEGYQLLPVFILADAEEIIKILCEAVYPHARFILYRLVSLTDFQAERVGRGVSLERYRQLFQYWYAHNKRIEKGLPFWVRASWPVQAVSAETLSQAIKLAEASEISIRYGVISSTELSCDFYFKVSFHHQFDRKLNEIRKILGLDYWLVVRRFLKDEEGEVENFDDEEAMPHLTHDTIPAFLDAIKPHL
jgi:hypothetical protein